MLNCSNNDAQNDANDYTTAENLDKLAISVVKLLYQKKLKLGTAESCTGGMLSQYITSVAGSSDIFEMGICSYSNRIKTQELFVASELLESFGAVSEQVAVAMAEGILKKSSADIGVGITGIAGPDGGTIEKPVGTVYVAVCFDNKKLVRNLKLFEIDRKLDRDEIRKISTFLALKMIFEISN